MTTLKIKYTSSEEFYPFLLSLRQKQTNLLHYCYNRKQEEMSDIDLRKNIKGLNNINLDSWLIDSIILKAKMLPKKVIFGGKNNFYKRLKGKISKEEYKANRLEKLYIVGERLVYGNRKFQLNIDKKEIIFKYKKDQKFIISLPKIRDNYLRILHRLEEKTDNKEIPYTVSLDQEYIYISFKEFTEDSIKLENRILSIDMNPNSLGYSILEFKNNDEFKIIDSGIIDNKLLNENLVGLPSNHPKKKYQNNKRKYEIYQISKFIIAKGLHFKVNRVVIEDLNVQAKNHNKGKNFNRLINSQWNRAQLEQSISKYCNIHEIKLIKVNPAYSSFISNLIFSEYPDPICSAIEIGRRGYNQFVRGKFYPKLIAPNNLPNHWKKEVDFSYKSWIELFNQAKKMELRYHFSQINTSKDRVFRLKHKKSKVDHIDYDLFQSYIF